MADSPNVHRFAVPMDVDGAHLRVMTLNDVDALRDAVERARGPLSTWVPHHIALDDAGAHVRIKMKQVEVGRAIEWGVWADTHLVGCISLHDLRFKHDSAELGYWLAPEATGRGLVTRAAIRLMEHAFVDMALHRVTLKCIVENHASRGVPERLGMVQEAVLRDEWKINGRYRDRVVYRMLVHEWKDRYATG